MATAELRSAPNEEFYRRLIAPEERKERRFEPWCGDFRWFKSNNVLPLEQYRSKEEWARIRARFWPKR